MDTQYVEGTAVTAPVRTTLGHLADRLLAFLPHLVAAAIILAVGLLIAWAIAAAAERLLRALGIDRFAARHRLPPRAIDRTASGLLCALVFWGCALVVAVAAADALGLPWLSAGLARVIAYIPNLVAAALIGLAGFVVGNLAQRAISHGHYDGAALLWGRLCRTGIFLLAAFMALEELRIAEKIVTAAFCFSFGAFCVACAVAFGLGNRDLAAHATRQWLERHRPPTGLLDGDARATPGERPLVPGDEPLPEPHH